MSAEHPKIQVCPPPKSPPNPNFPDPLRLSILLSFKRLHVHLTPYPFIGNGWENSNLLLVHVAVKLK